MNIHDITKLDEFYSGSGTSFSKMESHIFFALVNRAFPSTREIRYYHSVPNLINRFREQFNVADENFFGSERFQHTDKSFYPINALAMVQQNLLVEFNAERSSPLVRLFFSHETDQQLLGNVTDMLKSEVKERVKQARIGLLTFDRLGLNIVNFPVEEAKPDLNIFYNDDLLPVNKIIVSKLNENKGKGVVLLHGQPGTGKTTYLRFLASVLKKQMIFIPFEVASRITSPDFLSFMLDNRDSVLILEDAEKLLRPREDGDNLNVASLLNISDGLLSDALHVQLICTFNTEIARIDKALVRKGRIIARYEFKPLTVEKAKHLASILGQTIDIEQPMTLAEIFHRQDEDYSIRKTNKIGF